MKTLKINKQGPVRYFPLPAACLQNSIVEIFIKFFCVSVKLFSWEDMNKITNF